MATAQIYRLKFLQPVHPMQAKKRFLDNQISEVQLATTSHAQAKANTSGAGPSATLAAKSHFAEASLQTDASGATEHDGCSQMEIDLSDEAPSTSARHGTHGSTAVDVDCVDNDNNESSSSHLTAAAAAAVRRARSAMQAQASAAAAFLQEGEEEEDGKQGIECPICKSIVEGQIKVRSDSAGLPFSDC